LAVAKWDQKPEMHGAAVRSKMGGIQLAAANYVLATIEALRALIYECLSCLISSVHDASVPRVVTIALFAG
jgi:hypothetical protein